MLRVSNSDCKIKACTQNLHATFNMHNNQPFLDSVNPIKCLVIHGRIAITCSVIKGGLMCSQLLRLQYTVLQNKFFDITKQLQLYYRAEVQIL
jgi:hypothetical protein